MVQNNINYLTVSVGQESGYSLTGFSASGSLTGCTKVLAGAAVICRLDWGSIHSELIPWLLEEFSSLLAVGWRLSLVLCHRDLSNMATWVIKASKQRRQDSAREMETSVFIT